MNTRELRDRLCEESEQLAELASADFPEATAIHVDGYVHVHGIDNREDLAAWVRLMKGKPEIRRSHGYCCVAGRIGVLNINVFYERGLLGEIVPPADGSTIESLLAETAAC